ncbi:MAG: rhodanese-like domain-containing protein [Paludibacteraceae bacterium]|nr:rhodanese-like domain-containing protein [Paludibacteraceae bacterium]
MKRVRLFIQVLIGICVCGFVSCHSGKDELCDHDKADPEPFNNYLEQQAEPQIVDYRSEADYAKGHIKGAESIPVSVVELDGTNGDCAYVKKVMAKFDVNKPLFVYGGNDAFGTNGMAVPGQLACKFCSVTLLVGGYDAWVEAGLPTEK